MLKIALVTNEPPPYRVPVFNRIAANPAVIFRVIFCCEREPNRHWNLPPFEFDHVFLKRRFATFKGRYIHNNPDVIGALRRFAPDVIVNDGLNPTHLYAFGWARLRGVPHVPLTDGTDLSEGDFGRLHVAARRTVYSHSNAFVAASRGGIRLFRSYGVDFEKCFLSPLCADNVAFAGAPPFTDRKFDLLFCGRMVEGKNPLFALDVAEAASSKIGRRLRLLFVGSGPLDELLKAEAQKRSDRVECVFNGFARQEALPGLYGSARVFLFPTAADVWGVVANEACAAGLPVIVSPFAGVGGELVVDEQNGYVVALDVQEWAERVCRLITDAALWQRFSDNSCMLVSEYSYDNAAEGIVAACKVAAVERRPAPKPGSRATRRDTKGGMAPSK
jgi:glycosyltransferase involved in cell wall biosynthesis